MVRERERKREREKERERERGGERKRGWMGRKRDATVPTSVRSVALNLPAFFSLA